MPGATAVLLVLLAQAATSVPPVFNADFPRYDRVVQGVWQVIRTGRSWME